MATSLIGIGWHDGEKTMHNLLRVPQDMDNPTVPRLNYYGHTLLPQAPLIAVGTLDSGGRPWTTIWGGSPGLSQALSQTIIGIKTPVESTHDPVVEAIFGKNADGKVIREQGDGRMISALTIDLAKRKRVKLYGRLMAGGVTYVPQEDAGDEASGDNSQRLVQLVIRIDQSLGNCPKYLNCKKIRPAVPSPSLLSDSSVLFKESVRLIINADSFFISSSNAEKDMDTNYRGGSSGFVRVTERADGRFEIIWPEYSGNRLYQTLGNLQLTPLAGLAFPDFDTGDVLYVTGSTEILVGTDAAKIIPRSNLAVRLTVQAARHVNQGLPFLGERGEASPYNPKIRPLTTETLIDIGREIDKKNSVILLSQTPITPTISRFRFTLTNVASWVPGQWIALDFANELDEGYSHMRDEDPRSLNDDYVRTFTVSSPPAPRIDLSDDEFEITIRRTGVVTGFLFKQNPLARLEVLVRGFGGDFRVEQSNDGGVTPFVAAGVGITPLLAHISKLDCSRLKCFWSIRAEDINLVLDTSEKHPSINGSLHIYVTGSASEGSFNEILDKLKTAGVQCELRRLQKSDLDIAGLSNRWHVCVSKTFYQKLQAWLPGKEFVFDDFDF